jgi:hypothetical protein
VAECVAAGLQSSSRRFRPSALLRVGAVGSDLLFRGLKALLLLVGFVRIVILAHGATTPIFARRHHAIEHQQAWAFELRGLGQEFCHRNPMLRQQRDYFLFLLCMSAEIIQGKILGVGQGQSTNEVVEVELQGLEQSAIGERGGGALVSLFLQSLSTWSCALIQSKALSGLRSATTAARSRR